MLQYELGDDAGSDDMLLDECFELVSGIPGDYAEFGVYQGATFLRIAEAAKRRGKTAFAFDSFRGLAEPEEIDKDPNDKYQYPKGKFDVRGSRRFRKLLGKRGFENYRIVEGFIPDTLRDALDACFCFAHVDLDHYRPTLQAAEWCFERLSDGGVIVFDDYFKGRKYLATPAIEEFLEKHTDRLRIGRIEGRKLFVRKREEAPPRARG